MSRTSEGRDLCATRFDQDKAASLSEPMACLWEGDERTYRLGVLGTGPGFIAVIDIARNPVFRNYLPDLDIVGIAEPGPNPDKLTYACALGLPVYERFDQLLADAPDLDMVIDLTGMRHRLRQLREELSPSVSLIDQDAAIFLCGLHDMAKSTGYFRDHLDRQRHLLRAIVDEVREDIMLLDLEGRVVDVNRNVWERTGKSKDELLGRSCQEVLTRSDGQLLCPDGENSCPSHACLVSGKPEEALITRVSTDGHLLYYRIYAYPIRNQSGALTHVMMMHRDITARTMRERHQQQTDKLAVIGEMSTYLAHEIRNPLMAIGGFTRSLLKSGNLDGGEREKLSIVAQETERLDRLLSSILNFARPSRTPWEAVSLPRVVRETVDLMRSGYARQGYAIDIVDGEDIPQIKGGAELVKQCLVNLIKNALEAMPGGGTVRVSTGLADAGVFLRVEDEGCGMSREDMERAFSPFYSTKEQGYGLGLAMMKKAVEEMGGSIDLQSRLGRGTTVTLLFPPLLAGEDGQGGAEGDPGEGGEGQGSTSGLAHRPGSG